MLQKTSSVFVVYRRKTLTGSPDPTHANGTDKPCTFRDWRDILIILFEFIVCTVYLHILLISMKIDAKMQNVSVSRDTIPGFLRVF